MAHATVSADDLAETAVRAAHLTANPRGIAAALILTGYRNGDRGLLDLPAVRAHITDHGDVDWTTLAGIPAPGDDPTGPDAAALGIAAAIAIGSLGKALQAIGHHNADVVMRAVLAATATPNSLPAPARPAPGDPPICRDTFTVT